MEATNSNSPSTLGAVNVAGGGLPGASMTRASSLRATNGNKIYKLALVDKIGSTSMSSSSSGAGISSSPSNSYTPHVYPGTGQLGTQQPESHQSQSGHGQYPQRHAQSHHHHHHSSTASVREGSPPSSISSVSATSTVTSPASSASSSAERNPLQVSKDRRRHKSFRLSISIPMAPPPARNPTTEDSPSVAPPLYISPNPPAIPASATVDIQEEHSDFLTLLAAKERRVLELKSELEREEAELSDLRKQWAIQEDRARRSAQLQAVTSGQTLQAKAPVSTRSSLDNKRSSVGANIGQRLLAPSFPFPSPPKTAPSGRPYAPPRTSSLTDTGNAPTGNIPTGNVSTGSVPTEQLRPSFEVNDEFEYDDDISSNVRNSIRSDDVIHMGRKLAEGINNHFWTFYEDLKQAAIGDDLVSAATEAALTADTSSGDGSHRGDKHLRSQTVSAHDRDKESVHDYTESSDYDEFDNPSPPVRHLSSFVNSPERHGADSPEYRGSPQGKSEKYRQNLDYEGYSVLQSVPAGSTMSTSLIDFEDDTARLRADKNEKEELQKSSSIDRKSKRWSMFIPTLQYDESIGENSIFP
ncbi:hypothetical protein V1511DRAFT_489635 [Dipodascopsis uninucleata]